VSDQERLIPFESHDVLARRIRTVANSLRMTSEMPLWRLELAASELDAAADLLDPPSGEEDAT
jgi:hypothetical protein